MASQLPLGWNNVRSSTVGLTTATVLVGNLMDALFTLTFLQIDIAQEANPLMRWAYEASPLSFVLAKLAMVALGLVLLRLHSQAPLARFAEALSATVYTGIVAYHILIVNHLPIPLATLLITP